MSVEHTGLEVAIIGLAGRFPGSQSIEEFWQHLIQGDELISVFSETDSNSAKPGEPRLMAAGLLKEIEWFDASFFGFSPRDAELMDPQHRIFLECAWEALESAGYGSEQSARSIGVYAGVGVSTYLLYNLFPKRLNNDLGYFPTLLASEKDYVPTRVSYKLNLNGPSLSVGTACSSSLVATHLAYQSVLSGECDMALAAGVSIKAPQNADTLCPEGIAPDGHCRAFDASAAGTIGGNGVGVVVLKRLTDAIADGDFIYAVIKGSAVNNDGAQKVSYTAPSEAAQTRVIQAAQLMAEVTPETVTYVETHGSGTPMGDPIEMAALKQAFSSNQTNHCAIGSVKTNIGHLDAAAGIAGLIKTVLALHHKVLPPSLHFETPNPQIDFDNSPFFVNTQLSEWQANGIPRRAGVSSFGFGGTNAHVILEEAPQQTLAAQEQASLSPWQLLILSAKTEAALEQSAANLCQYLQHHPQVNLADVAYTLQQGRQNFPHKRAVIAQSVEDAISALQDPKRILTAEQEVQKRSIAFMFTGLGSQYEDMAKELYHIEPVFAQQVDRCCQILEPLLGIDLKEIIFPPQTFESTDASAAISDTSAQKPKIDLRQMLGRDRPSESNSTTALNQTHLTQPAIFVIEYALAKLWQSCAIHPNAMVGYSIGEYVAATLAGVLSLEEALTLVAKRAAMIAQLPAGAMLAVPLSEEAVQPLLNGQLSLSAVNGAAQCVVAGEIEAIDQLQAQLIEQGLACRRLKSSHAFHSHMMAAIVPEFKALVAEFELQPPSIPYLSNLTGTWITPDQAVDPDYWVQHLCQPVRFADQVQALWQQQQPILLEIGAGQTLSSLALQCLDQVTTEKIALASLRHAYENQSDVEFILNTVAQLWLAGIDIDWTAFSAQQDRYRIPLPTYPFQRQHYWVDPPGQSSAAPSRLITPELWQSLVTIAQDRALEGVQALNTHIHEQQRRSLDRLCTAYMNQAFRQLEAFCQPEKTYTLEDLLEQTGVIPRYQELLVRWLDVLVEKGCLQRDNAGKFSQLEPLAPGLIEQYLDDVKAKSAEVLSLDWIDVYHTYGMNLSAILTGKRQPQEFHYSTRLQEADYTVPEHPSMEYYGPIVTALVKTAIDALPTNNKLRVLELGAGTGSLTELILPLLPEAQTEYTFTDAGNFFLTTSQQKFSQYPFVNYGVLDVEKAPQDQGYLSHSFDLVIAFNVLHVARNIETTIEYARSLLAPGGLLLLWEVTEAKLEADIVDGVLMQPIADPKGERNMGNPFLSHQQWKSLLLESGFTRVESFSEFSSYGEHVLIAEADNQGLSGNPLAFTIPQHKEVVIQDNIATAQFSPEKKPDITDWFSIPVWTRLPLASVTKDIDRDCWLVFADDDKELGEQLVKRLEQDGHRIAMVKPGAAFSKTSLKTDQCDRILYTVNPRQQSDYEALVDDLLELNLLGGKLVHGWSLNALSDDFDADDYGFYSLLFLFQALGKRNIETPIEISVLTQNLHEVTGTEELEPRKALALGPCRVMPVEYPQHSYRSIDVVLSQSQQAQSGLVDKLITELYHSITDETVAYRGQHRWVQTFNSVQLPKHASISPALRDQGIYLITGGLGRIGLTIAHHLASTVRARLVLCGRSNFPQPEQWQSWLNEHDDQDSTSEKIRQLMEIQRLGGDIMIVQGDVSQLTSMQELVEQVKHQWGDIQGVIHAAGIPVPGTILTRTPDSVKSVFAAKVEGTFVLEQVFRSINLDFLILFSSLSSLSGGYTADYVAASHFLDTYANAFNRSDQLTISIDWDTWQMSLQSFISEDLREFYELNQKANIAPGEGAEAFGRILQQTFPQIVISSKDLQVAIKQHRSAQRLESGTLVTDASNSADGKQKSYPRPNLRNAYVEATSEAEQMMTELWQKFLGIEPIGIHDNFFALGGDSLTGSILINELRDRFQVELPVRSLFEYPTVGELALVIENILIEELETLDEQDVEVLLG